ncbi:MAG TPA: tol-pal system protein YbgF [Dissulfurispiraceae bacterium]|nr:tol-pal system protein YbgF [Dissulfurispiraceae bacterium]
MQATWRGRLLAAMLLTASVFSSGCLTPGESDSLKRSVANLQFQSEEQRKETADLKMRLDALAQDLNAVGAIRENQSSVLTKTYDFSKELQALKGRFEENRYQNEKTFKDMALERELMNAKISALENEILKAGGSRPAYASDKKAVAVSPSGPAAPAGAVPAEPNEEKASEPQKLYDEGQVLLKAKKYPEAREKFQRLVKDNPKHQLIPSARYWIGESYYAEKKFNDAIIEFDDVWQKYPKHDKARPAMLKEGYAFYDSKDCRASRVILQKLIEKYPQTDEAKLAEKKIAEINADKSCAPKKKKPATPKKKKTSSN